MKFKIIDRTQMREKVDLNADEVHHNLFKCHNFYKNEGLELRAYILF